MLVSMQTMHRYKRQRLRQRKRKRGTEREYKKTHEKQEYKNSSASRDALSADQKESPDSRKNSLTIQEESSACHRKCHQGRQYVNSGISKEIENPHDLNEHLNFCVKIDMQLAVSTRSHNTHQCVIGASMERKRKRERGGARNTDTSKACARHVKIRTTTCSSKRK